MPSINVNIRHFNYWKKSIDLRYIIIMLLDVVCCVFCFTRRDIVNNTISNHSLQRIFLNIYNLLTPAHESSRAYPSYTRSKQ